MKRLAVSILMTRDLESTETFLVKRNPKLKFFGGFLAFPGGTLDAGDSELAGLGLIRGGGADDSEFATFVVAAARELFEETGVWAGHGRSLPSGRLRKYRRQLLAEEIPFSEILKAEEQTLDATDFEPICRITTPPFRPVRYDTWFLRYRMPAGAEPEVWPGELEFGKFVLAEDALAAWRRQEDLIVPPVLNLLRQRVGRDSRGFVQAVRGLTDSYARGKLHQVYFSPGVLLAPLLTRPLPPASYTNACVVGEQDLYLVDPGSEDAGEQEKLWELLDELQEEGRTLRGILLTHHHVDHVGAVGECRRRYALPVYAHRRTGLHLPGIPFAGFLEDGQSLELGRAPDGEPGWRLEVYHLPGHASGHLAFRETRYGAVLAGDLVSTLSPILIEPSDGDLAAYMNSLEILDSLCDSFLYPAHGPPLPQGRSVIRKTLEHRRKREERLLEELRPVPRSEDTLLERVYADVAEELLPLARLSLRSGLIKLVAEGKAREVNGGYARVASTPGTLGDTP